MSSIIQKKYSQKRQHYVFDNVYTFKLKPRLIYVGTHKRTSYCEKKHSHDFCEIIFVINGHGYVTVNEQEYFVKKGDIVIYNPCDEHFEKSSDTEPFEFIFFAIDRFEIMNMPKNCIIPKDYKCVYPSGKTFDVLNQIFCRMLSEINSKERYYAEILKELARTALMYIIRVILADENPIKPYYNNKVLNMAIDYINNNLSGDLSLDNIAANCFVSKYYLSHLFSSYKGIGIGKYILELRIKEAKYLLKTTDKKVNEISEEIGFNDTSYFCRAFKKEVGCTPLKYRNEIK